jgi:hypothetical protein
VNLVSTVSTTTVYGTIKGKLAEAKAMVFKARMTGRCDRRKAVKGSGIDFY